MYYRIQGHPECCTSLLNTVRTNFCGHPHSCAPTIGQQCIKSKGMVLHRVGTARILGKTHQIGNPLKPPTTSGALWCFGTLPSTKEAGKNLSAEQTEQNVQVCTLIEFLGADK